jgi:hypothetical protein
MPEISLNPFTAALTIIGSSRGYNKPTGYMLSQQSQIATQCQHFRGYFHDTTTVTKWGEAMAVSILVLISG